MKLSPVLDHLRALFSRFSAAFHEPTSAPFVPYSCQVSPDTIKTRTGDYLRIWQLAGLPFETTDPSVLADAKENLNKLFLSIGSEDTQASFYFHQVRRPKTVSLPAIYANPFCRALDERYYEKVNGSQLLVTELYITLIYRPSTEAGGQLSRIGRTVESIQHAQDLALRKLTEFSAQLETTLRDYGPKRLTSYEKDEAVFSEPLRFLNFLLSGFWQDAVRVPSAPLYEYLGTSHVLVGHETVELREPTKTRVARILYIKDYPKSTVPGILDGLLYLPVCYVLTQSFSLLPKQEGKALLSKQQKQLAGSEDGSATQIHEITKAIDHLTQGEFLVGDYDVSLAVWGEEGDGTQRAEALVKQLREDTTKVQACLQEAGLLPTLVTTALEPAYYAQLPGNWSFRPRPVTLTSKNVASLVSLHNFRRGKKAFNPWGHAVTTLTTPSQAPYYFNFHHVSAGDQTGEMVLAHTLLLGQSGAGKTVLLAFLLCQLQKFNPVSFFFDKDRGAELIIRALGGKYLALTNGEPSGLNPFQLEPNEPNFQFLEQLVGMLVASDGYTLTAGDIATLSTAVRTVMRFPKEVRRLSRLPENMTDRNLIKRVERWCVGGPLAWVFDNETDAVDFTTHQTYGIDGTSFLDQKEIRSPLSFYFLYRMRQILDGRRVAVFMDEFWKWLADNAFSEFVHDGLKTMRKLNCFCVFATQSPSDVLSSPIASAVVEQCATMIYLPNPRANQDEYTKHFKLSPTEFEVLQHIPADRRLFLVKQGENSVIAGLNLQGLEEELAILSSSAEKVALLHEIMNEVGEDPNVWLPLFHARMAARKTAR